MENVSITVNKAIDILEVFLSKQGEVSLTEISAATGVNVATAHRLLSTLVRRGYLSQPEKNGRYTVGLKMLDFNYAIRRNMKFLDLAYVSLSKLTKEHNQSTFLATLDADTALIVEEVGVTEDLRINSPVGKRFPLHSTACGKALLASLSAEERAAYYLRNPLQPVTANTVTQTTQLEGELADVTARGVAFDSEEYRMGLWIAAAPVYNGNGKVIAAAGIMVPTSDVNPDSVTRFATAIKSCAAKISGAIARII